MITQTTNLNLIPGGVLPVVHVSQYDYKGRTLAFKIYNGVAEFTLTSEMTAKVQGTKPDNKGFSFDATVDTTNGLVTIDIEEQMTAVAGNVQSEVRLLKGEENIGTVNFILRVEPAGLADDVDISETVLPEYISGAQTAAAEAAASAREAEGYATSDYAQIAKSWAVGPSGSGTSGTNTNNAKYWSDKAFSGTPDGYSALVDLVNSLNSSLTKRLVTLTSEFIAYRDQGLSAFSNIVMGTPFFDILQDIEIPAKGNATIGSVDAGFRPTSRVRTMLTDDAASTPPVMLKLDIMPSGVLYLSLNDGTARTLSAGSHLRSLGALMYQV